MSATEGNFVVAAQGVTVIRESCDAPAKPLVCGCIKASLAAGRKVHSLADGLHCAELTW